MKTLYISIIFLITFSITYSQDITATLGGNTPAEGFSVVNAQGDTVFRITGEGNVGIKTTTPTSIFDVQGGSSNAVFGRGINLITESGTDAGSAGNIMLKCGSGMTPHGVGGSISILAGSADTGGGRAGNITISSGTGADGGDISINTGTSGYYNSTTGAISITTASNFQRGAGGINISTGNGTADSPNNNIKLSTGTNQFGGGDIILEVASTYPYDFRGNIILTPHTGGGLVKINGSGTYTGTWTQASDERFKSEIEPLHNSLDKIQQLNGISYEFRKDEFPEKNFDDGKQIGLIAQDVEKVFPELVETDSDGYKSIAYQNMVAVLIEAVKEQQKIIDNQNEKITEIQSTLNSLITKVELSNND